MGSAIAQLDADFWSIRGAKFRAATWLILKSAT